MTKRFAELILDNRDKLETKRTDINEIRHLICLAEVNFIHQAKEIQTWEIGGNRHRSL